MYLRVRVPHHPTNVYFAGYPGWALEMYKQFCIHYVTPPLAYILKGGVMLPTTLTGSLRLGNAPQPQSRTLRLTRICLDWLGARLMMAHKALRKDPTNI